MTRIVATATGLPANYYSQDDLIAAFRSIWAGRHYNLDRLEQFHRNVLVGGRHLALTIDEYQALKGFGDSNDAWTRVALQLAEETVSALLEKARLPARGVHQIVFTTVTGLAVPSIEARLMNRLDFDTATKRVPLFGLGCLAGAAGLARLYDYLHGHPDEAGILLSVELCSLTLQREDLSIPNIISSGLFGDGAAAVLMAGANHPLSNAGGDFLEHPRPKVLGSRSIFFPDSERVMGWDIVDSGFKVVLSSDVAPFTRTHLRPGVDAFLSEYDLTLKDMGVFVAHPGGPKVIEAMAEALEIDVSELQLSLDSLAQVGNLSSASVLFVLQETLKQKRPAPGTYGLLMAMGPAFSAEAVLLQW